MIARYVMQAGIEAESKGRELVTFLVLAVLIWPVIACAVVGAYGLGFWLYFMLVRLPGPS